VKISLPFNIVPALEGTGIADSFKLKTKDGKTLIELGAREEEYFLAVLAALEGELRYRMAHRTAQSSRSPLSPLRKNSLREHSDLLIQARVLIEKARANAKPARHPV
jgi:hypothetical protein